MAKENLKINVVEAPTLFVGVGGTGCDVVKRVAEKCRPGEAENINFVCLDTNVNDLSSIKKSDKHIYHVQTSNTQTVGNYLYYDEDALKNWFPKNAVLYDKTVSEGAGQVRAISRLALNSTIKTGRINELYDAIDDLFRKTGKELKQAMRVVMVSTTSGGTGSGIVMPLAMFIRDYVKNKYPNTSLIVRSLLMLPETLDSVIKSTVEKDSQRRNAYATIKEINAFMMKGSGFFDIDEDLKRYNNLYVDFALPGTDEKKRLSMLPFDFCFLMDGQDAEDSTLVNVEQYKELAAQALYEQNIGPMQKKAFSVEDNIIKEMANPGIYGRNRFGGIGASVLRYPYEDVADYIAYDWAIDSIGGEGEAAKWSKYDNEYARKKKEAEKKGLSREDTPTLAEVYISKMDGAQDTFSKDLRAKFLSDADDRVEEFFTELANEMHEAVKNNSAIMSFMNQTNKLAGEIDYKEPDNRGHAVDNLRKLRNYEMAVNANASKAAVSTAENILLNETKTINEKKPYTIEALLKNAYEDICHPNAARYMLYKAKNEFEERIESVSAEIRDTIKPALREFSSRANNPGMYDLGSTKETEYNLDGLCKAEKAAGEDPSLFEKIGGYEKIYEKLNECFVGYHNKITELMNKTAELEAYTIGFDYVKDLCETYERFYKTFGEKVSTLTRRKEEMVDDLAFRKGNSVYNVCASKALIEELSRSTMNISSEGDMLDKELNGQIFDAVKANVRFEREIRFADIVEEDRRVDIFDDILLGYYKNSVRQNCANIDMNIIEAIAMENRLKGRLKARQEQKDGESKIFDKVTQEDNERYIKEMIAMGHRLAAPSIQRITNEEPREISLCAYNSDLLNMRSFRVKEVIDGNSEAVDTISRYELHFFNALYNLTPDKLNKFACPLKTETGMKNAGLYHNAYMTYAKRIGPDSTKNIATSTHIDKRWDSLAVMPEIDFDFQDKRMMKIHKAMIYALVYEAIRYQNLSVAANGKMVYKYENSEERYEEMVVSNGTLCDEFYEILDALYISSAMVEDIEVIKAKKSARDSLRNSSYAECAFARALEGFAIDEVHEGPTSIFEIPLQYYNSLPNSKRYVGEITDLIEAAIDVLREEIEKTESEDDAKFILCDELKEQFVLLTENYKNFELMRNNLAISENPVIDIVFRKVKNVLTSTPEPDDFEDVLTELKNLIR